MRSIAFAALVFAGMAAALSVIWLNRARSPSSAYAAMTLGGAAIFVLVAGLLIFSVL